ncbi:Zn-dependent alcohol dehydrogenase [Rhodobacteraceae bacterium F11138]|nr:Zn-dependent alcohol dehydrogenase [Rhodobacteraceae bacterium F11138]
MKAAILHEFGADLAIEDVTLGNPGHNEVRVEVAATGLCHTDLHFMRGHLPLETPAVLGHETAGVVRAVGAGVSYLKPGDHVIGCLSAFCGCCEMCLSGRPSICEGSDVLHRGENDTPRLSRAGKPVTQFMNLSGFAEEILVHEHALTKVDSAMPLDRAALIGCGVMTGWGAVTRTAQLRAGETVAVFGCGAVGLSTVQAARIAGATVIVAVDLNDDRLATAQAFGATHTINPGSVDAVDEILAATNGKGVNFAFDAVGNPALVKQCFLSTRKAGTTIMIGLMGLQQEVALPFGHFIAERKVMGCDMGSNQFRTDMPRLARLYMDGRLNLDDMLTARLPIERINDGFAAMDRGEGIRTIIDFKSE